MMSQEANQFLHNHHHHQQQQHFSEFSAIAGNASVMSSFDPAGGHNPFVTMEMVPNPSWRGFEPEGATVAAVPGAWLGETSSLKTLHSNQVQSLSLSLFNPPQPGPSFQLSHPIQIKNCKYLLPAQELLNEFCSLGGGINSNKRNNSNSNKPMDESSSSWNQQSLYSMEPLELQKRKAKLLSMLEEVDRRYRRYCEQMKAVVSTFEEVAGEGAASTYSMLASKAMSRHFRCLRDGITGQIKATRRAMGENDSSITQGLTRGETPRLKLLDQTLRQHKSFQQAGMMENHPWRPQRGLPERSVSILRAWLFEHFLHPYPSDVDKHILARQTGLSRSQVSNWFINARVRLWKPMVEEMYIEEIKEEEESSMQPSLATTMHEGGNISNSHAISNPNPSSSSQPHFDHQDHKPGHIPGHLQINDDPHSLSSIISNMHAHHSSPNPNPNHSFGGIHDADFGSYRSGHELTLGLQQYDRPLLFSREPIDVCDDGDAVQFSMLVGDHAQNIPCRNLMGAQLLHDLAG